MAKPVRFDVRCTICKKVFQNDLEDTLYSEDYIGNHSLTSSLGIQYIGSLKDISMSKDSHPVQPRNIKFPWLASSIERLLHHSMIDTLG